MNDDHASLPSFLRMVRAARYEDLLDLAQKHVPPICPSEPFTITSLNTFFKGVQQTHNPILSDLKTTFSTTPYHLSNQLTNDVEFLQKLICVVGHVTRVVPYKRPYGEYIQVVFTDLLIPILDLRDPQWTLSVVKLKREVFETIAKLLELFETQTNKYMPMILPFLEVHFQAVLDGKAEQTEEVLDLLAMMLQSYGKLFAPTSLVALLKVMIGIFFTTDDVASKAELLDVIGHITKKLLHSITPSTTPTNHLPKTTLNDESNYKIQIETFPSQEITQMADYIAEEVMPVSENLDLWFEKSVMVLALFCGISSRTGDVSFHKKIFELTSGVYIDQLKKIKHDTEPERQYNIFLLQAIGRAIDHSDSTVLQPHLPEFYSELRNLNNNTKEIKSGTNVKQKTRQYYQKLRGVLIRTIASVMKAYNDFTPLADQFLRETAKELADPVIFGDFIEALRDHAPKYLGPTLRPLFRQLEKGSVSMKIKQAIIETINKIIKHTKAGFLPFLQECADMLRPMAPSLVTDSCIPFVSIYTTILVTFGETSDIDKYIPFLLPTFIDILNQDSPTALGLPKHFHGNDKDEKDEMDLSPFSICEALSNLRSIFGHPPLFAKVLQICPTFLPEILIYLMDHITSQDESYVRVAQLEFIQQLLDSLPADMIHNELSLLVSLIIQNIEFNTNEIDIQIASFDTIARFVAHDVPDLAMRAHIHTVCTGSLFLAKEQNELNASIQRVLTSLNEKK